MPPKKQKTGSKPKSIASRLARRQITGSRYLGRAVYGELMIKQSLSRKDEMGKQTAVALSRTRDPSARKHLNEKLENLNRQRISLRLASQQPGRYFWEDGLPVHRHPPPTGGSGIAT